MQKSNNTRWKVLLLNETQRRRVLRKWLERESETQAIAEMADAGFDGGEWSGPRHAAQWENRVESMEHVLSVSVNSLEEHTLS